MGLVALTRRDLLLLGFGGTAAFAVGAYGGFRWGRRTERRQLQPPPRDQAFAPNAFVAIDTAGNVTIWLNKADLGQGVATTLPMLVAEELGAKAEQVRLELAPAAAVYGNQFTAVSSSTKEQWLPLRQAGAAAREMLIGAAAAAWACPAAECVAVDGRVQHRPSGRQIAFGDLASAAARLPVPNAPPLKSPREFRYLGRAMPRLDHAAKVDGSARYGCDVRLPGMLFAVVARCPVPGGRLRSYEATAALAVPGVVAVHAEGQRVFVCGTTTHAAMLGREALVVQWDPGEHATASSAEVMARALTLLEQPGAIARREGVGVDGLAGAGQTVTAEYRLPYLAHATMEPMNCTAEVLPDACRIYVPTQAPQSVQQRAAQWLGLPLAAVLVQPTHVGGGFGRRVAFDFVEEALVLARHLRRPVQVVWTREDDFAHDLYRPCSAHRLVARLDAAGLPVAWQHRIVTPSILGQDPSFRQPIDPVAVEGAMELPYGIADLQVEFTPLPAPFPIGFWRSVGHSFNAFAVECFVDEVAVAAGRDAVALRRELLTASGQEAHRAVLDLAVARAGPELTGDGVGRGVALHASFGSMVAMVVDLRVTAGAIRIERVCAAVDCGYAVHPDGVRAQIEGAVAFALSAVLHGEVAFADGKAQASNFHDQPLLRFAAMPAVTVHLVERDEPPATLGGVGEIGVPPVAPAVANALFRATGQRVRSLPLRR